MGKYINKKLLSVCIGAGSVVLVPIASVGADSSQLVLEEVTVTANKRGAVAIQDMAGSVQAISSETLEDLGAEGFEDYIKLVPGLTSVSSGTGQSQIVIRGVNSGRVDHQSVQAKSLAGLYIDDTPISLAGFNPDLGLLDVERVEVLRGPQGTLYGASSMSGTVRVITRRPSTDSMFGKVLANVSNTQDGGLNYGVNGSINIPLSDSMALSVGAYYTDKDGFIDNVAPGGSDDYNSEDTKGFRAVLAYDNESFSATGTLMYNKLTADGRPDEMAIAETNQAIIDANNLNASVTGEPLTPNIALDEEMQAFKPSDDKFESEFKGANLKLEWDLEHYNIVSSTSYFDSEVSNVVDEFFRGNSFLNNQVAGLGGTGPNPIGGVVDNTLVNNTDNETLIEEFRVSSKSDGPWQWVLGFYFEDTKRDLGPRTLGGPGLEEQLIAAGHVVQTTNPDTIIDTVEKSEIQQRAFFGEIAFQVTDDIEITFGTRTFDYSASYAAFNNGHIFGRPNQTGISDPKISFEESDWLQKGQISWDVTEDAMVYAVYSEGFRLGGVADNVASTCDDELTALGVPTGGGPYGSDNLKNYEIGAKTSWMDNRLTANLARFRIVWENIQQTVALDCGFSTTLNVGEIENTGFEGELAFQATEHLALRLGFAVVDAEVSEVPDVAEPPNQKGDRPPYVSDFTASGSIAYEGIEFGAGEGFIRADVRHVSESENEFDSSPSAVGLPSYTVVDLTAGYSVGAWDYSLFARNLTDEEIITNADPDRSAPLQFTRGRPRTIGFSVARRFD